MYYRNMR